MQDKDLPIIFTGGMDQDSDLRTVAHGDFIDALNTQTFLMGKNAFSSKRNVPGNSKVVNQFLTTGENKVIGYYEDNKGDSGIYFVYSSIGCHGIYRYFRNKPIGSNGTIERLAQILFPTAYILTDNPLNFDPDHLITGIDLIGDLLFWAVDNNRPRMMNVARANGSGKKEKFRLYFNHDILATTGAINFQFNIYQGSVGTELLSLTWTSSSKTLADLVNDFITAYQENTTAVGLFNAVNSGDYITIEMTSAALYFAQLLETTNNTVNWAIPDNFYPDKLPGVEQVQHITTYDYFSQDLIDRIKYPPACQPSAVYITDPLRDVNLVHGKDFQFRVQYVYDNFEKSVWGAISNIAIPPDLCNGVGGNENNCISIDYTDPRLNNVSLNCIISSINIAVREHTTGDWQIVENVKPAQWGIGKNIYKFYNDRTYTILSDQNEFIKAYDSVGLLVKSQKLVNDRLFDGGITEGYNTIPLDADIKITAYKSPAPVKTYSIRGILSIRGINHDLADLNFCYNQPIYTVQDGSLAHYGAYGLKSNVFFPNYVYAAEQLQFLPLNGFCVYLAGTPYYAITQQLNLNGANGTIQTGTTNVFETPTLVEQERLDFIIRNDSVPGLPPSSNPFNIDQNIGKRFDQNSNPIYDPAGIAHGNHIYSTFEIKNVPAGRYVIRWASPSIVQAEIDNGNYQRTSGNVVNAFGYKGQNGQAFEATIVVGETTVEKDGFVYVGSSSIAECVSVNPDTLKTPVIQGYLTDHDNAAVVTTSYNSMLFDEGTRIDRNMAFFNLARLSSDMLVDDSLNPGGSLLFSYWFGGQALSDHNGYFWISYNPNTFGTPFNLLPLTSGAFQSGGDPCNVIAAKTSSDTPWITITNSTATGVFRNGGVAGDAISNYSRTFLTGTVQALGEGLPNVNVVNTHGAVQQTSLGNPGYFQIPAYKDSYITSNDRRRDSIIFNSGTSSCVLDFPDGDIYPYGFVIPVLIGNHPLWYNGLVATNTAHLYYNVGTVLAEILNSSISQCAFKDGADIQFGIVYYDEADRCTAVCTNDNLKIHFPFYTEFSLNAQGNLVQQSNGLPVVQWEVRNDPPIWAKKWQWVRTKNMQVNYYLQWAINSVSYINDEGGAAGQFDATKILINISNLTEYANRHPEESLSYSFTKGDRLRLMKTRGGALFPDYYDFEILATTTTTPTITIPNDYTLQQLFPGDIFEIYTPRNQQAVNIYYEFSECYPVNVEIVNGIKKYYHAGSTQDQSYLPAPRGLTTSNPATGQFKYGDVYYRIRAIPVFDIGSATWLTTLAYIDDASISDFYSSQDEMIGRPNTDAIDIGRIYRPTAIRFSNQYVENTKINGLSSFDALNQKQLSTDYGLINKLLLIGDDVLMSVCENSKIVTTYVNKGILAQATGAQLLVAISDEVLPRTNILMQTFGSQNPESVILNDYRDVYMWDKQVSTIPRYTSNALTPVNTFKMTAYFNGVSQTQLSYPIAKSPAVYDRYRDEYVVSFSPIAPVVPLFAKATICIPYIDQDVVIKIICQPLNVPLMWDYISLTADGHNTAAIIATQINAGSSGFSAVVNKFGCVDVTAPTAGSLYNNNSLIVEVTPAPTAISSINLNFPLTGGSDESNPNSYAGDTIAFAKEKDRWQTRYSFVPEYFGSIRNEIMSFKDGELWLHGVNPLFNNFYGVQYSSAITFASNKHPEKIKIYKAIAIDGNSIWLAPEIIIPPNSMFPIGMKTFMPALKFVGKEGKFYSDILNDLNTPYALNQTEALINGRPMRGQAAQVTLQNDATSYAVINEVEVTYIYSEKS